MRVFGFGGFNQVLLTEQGPLLINYSSGPISPANFWLVGFNAPATLIQLDHDLNLLWAKTYHGEHFPYVAAGIAKAPNGNLLLSHSTLGAYPAVLTELDSLGNILSQKGYPNHQPQMDILPDGSLVMASAYSFDSLGNTELRPVIAKTDPDGEIAGCTTLPTCLWAQDTTFVITPLDIWEVPPTDSLVDFELDVTPVSFSFTEGCTFPPPPVPEFSFPDTLCAGDSARTTGTHNRLANAHEWHLTGPGVDSVETTDFDFAFEFAQAGGYRLE